MYKRVSWGIENPDVTVRVVPEHQGMPPFAVLDIDDVTFFPNHIMHSLHGQLDELERIARLILEGVQQVRPDIPKVA